MGRGISRHWHDYMGCYKELGVWGFWGRFPAARDDAWLSVSWYKQWLRNGFFFTLTMQLWVGGGPFFQGKLGSNVNLHMENNHFSKMGIGHSKFPSPETFQFLNPLITPRRPKLYKRSYRISWKWPTRHTSGSIHSQSNYSLFPCCNWPQERARFKRSPFDAP